MPMSTQQFLANAIRKTASDLIKAYLQLPEDKRPWSPSGSARTAHDMIAECTLINKFTADTIIKQAFSPEFMEVFSTEKEQIKKLDWDTLHHQFEQNTDQLQRTVGEISESDLDLAIQLPWGPMSMAQIAGNALWNMGYHEGQISYIGALLS